MLDELAGVVESAVIGVPHPDFGEGVDRRGQAAPGAGLDEADDHRRLAPRLAAFKTPKRVFVVDDLPRNAMGKVQKANLSKQYREIFKG